MHPSASDPDPTSAPDVDAELDRICESRAFRHSLRHQQFLRHVVARKRAGALAELREIALAIDFFRRPAATFDPKADAVVRIEAARLRQRLERYYDAEGATARIEIALDRGSYLPVIRARARAAVALGAQPAVVVLPPTAPAGDEGARERAAALGDEIVQTLQRLPDVRLLGAQSTARLDGALPERDLVAELGVRWLIRTNWEPGPPAAVVVTLTPADTGEAAAAFRLALDGDDVPALHQRLRQDLLHRFAPLIGRRPVAALAPAAADEPPATTHHDAFDLFQRARYILKQRNAALLPKAVAMLEEAVRLDPRFAAAWSELAQACTQRRALVMDPRARDPAPAVAAAQRALELDPRSGVAWSILAGLAYTTAFDWPEADRRFEQALACSPRDPAVRAAYANFLLFSARFDEALREHDVLQSLDPLNLGSRCDRGALFFYWRRHERAESLLEHTLEIAPHYTYALLLLADSHAVAGRAEESLAAAERMLASAPDYANSHVYRARALLLLGRSGEADAVLAAARVRFEPSLVSDYEEAQLAIARGDPARALACLERYAAARANGAHCMAVDPTFGALHERPEWPALLARVGLPDFRARLPRPAAAIAR